MLSERDRFALYDRLGEVLGSEPAGWMMELLPPTPWEEFATKGDIASVRADITALGQHMEARFTSVDARFESIDARFEQVDARFESIDARFEQVDARFAQMDARFDMLAGSIELRLARQTRTLVALMIGFAITVWVTLLTGALYG